MKRGVHDYSGVIARLLSLLVLCLAVEIHAACPGLPEGAAVRWIIPSKPGGGYDAYSRLLQPFLERELGVRMMLVNRPAAGGVVAAVTIRDAAADGMTLGIINAPGLLAANALSGANAPDPGRDFSILGRVVSNRMVLLSGKDSEYSSLAQLLDHPGGGPLLVGVRDAGSASFITVPITASLLGFNYAMVTGYVGSAARTMALLRGEVDIAFQNLDSARRYIEAGDLQPLLQITHPTVAHTGNALPDILGAVPVLGGASGVATTRAAATGRTAQQAQHAAAALGDIFAPGRVVVAPAGLPAALANCLGGVLHEVLHSEELLLAAQRAQLHIDAAGPAAVERALAAAMRELQGFLPLLQSAIDSARQQ